MPNSNHAHFGVPVFYFNAAVGYLNKPLKNKRFLSLQVVGYGLEFFFRKLKLRKP